MATSAIASTIQSGASALTSSVDNGGALADLAPSGMVGQAELLEDEQHAEMATASIMQQVRLIAGAMIGISVLVIVLNEVFSLQSISNSTGPFSGVIDSLESTGGAALGLLVVGLLVVSANAVMSFFGRGGF